MAIKLLARVKLLPKEQLLPSSKQQQRLRLLQLYLKIYVKQLQTIKILRSPLTMKRVTRITCSHFPLLPPAHQKSRHQRKKERPCSLPHSCLFKLKINRKSGKP